MALIACENLTIGYEGNAVLRNVNFSVAADDFIVIVGSNGSGKTSLINALMGLIKPFGGKIISDTSLIKGGIGFAPQANLVEKDFPASVYEAVISARTKRFFHDKQDRKRALECLEIFGISDLKNISYQRLSGGQRQKVLLARILCGDFPLLILDEPSNSLDIKTQGDLYRTLRSANEKGSAIILISHDVQKVSGLAKTFLCLKDGVVDFFGSDKDWEARNV